jgi:hypothetical protein
MLEVGSKAFIYYAPPGNKTAVTVVGDFKIAGVSDEEGTKKAVMQMLERSFDEDVATFKSMK